MSINDEFKNIPQNEVKKEEKVEENKKEKTPMAKKTKIYLSILGVFLAIVVVLGAITIHSALTYVVGCFEDYSMAPTINSKIYDEEGNLYTQTNFRERNGNIVEYGLIEPLKTYGELKRFDVVAMGDIEYSYFFEASRVVGLPGEKVKLDYYGNLYINDELINQPIDKEYLKMDWSSSLGNPEDLYYEALLGENEYYLLKDNRFYYENDSRIKGPYKLGKIYGKVIAIQGTCEVKGSNFINCSIPWTRFI